MSTSREFDHHIDPVSFNRSGLTVSLTTEEIERAGLLEILQTPGPLLMSGAILDALLSDKAQFIFSQPLGQAREVKVALSGLFGRFVARAYLTKVHDYLIFEHLSHANLTFEGGQTTIEKCSQGDLPDWAVWRAKSRDLTIAEAKGSHEFPEPSKTLERAWRQANRVEVLRNGKPESVGRIAIVTRWGIEHTDLSETRIDVQASAAAPTAPQGDLEGVIVDLARGHYAALLSRLGHIELADAMLSQRRHSPRDPRQSRLQDSLSAFERAPSRRLRGDSRSDIANEMIGNVVVRSGPLREGSDLSPADQEALARLDLKPVFVGVDRSVIRPLIQGDLAAFESALALSRVGAPDEVDNDGAGTFIQRLGEGFTID
ncbi:MAG: hypothetical protein ACREEB_07620 [Caulobacteraceae bacterium]